MTYASAVRATVGVNDADIEIVHKRNSLLLVQLWLNRLRQQDHTASSDYLLILHCLLVVTQSLLFRREYNTF